jgi:hypothetical protein
LVAVAVIGFGAEAVGAVTAGVVVGIEETVGATTGVVGCAVIGAGTGAVATGAGVGLTSGAGAVDTIGVAIGVVIEVDSGVAIVPIDRN